MSKYCGQTNKPEVDNSHIACSKYYDTDCVIYTGDIPYFHVVDSVTVTEFIDLIVPSLQDARERIFNLENNANPTDHSGLTNLSSDDHLQYHTDGRADIWLTSKTTDDIAEGTNLYFLESRVLATTLNNFAIGTTDQVTSTDTVQQGLEKLQAQINAVDAEEYTLSTIDVNHQFSLLKTGVPVANTLDLTPYLQTNTSDLVNDGASGTSTYLEADQIGVSIQPYNANTTLAGNTFNGVNELVQLNGAGQLPAIDGSLLTNLAYFTSPLTTKGDLFTFDTGDQRLPVGTDGQVLSANSAQTTGLEWINPPAGVTNTSDLVNDGADNTSTYVEHDELATVATSGNYSDLGGLPTLFTSPLTTKGDIFVYDSADQRLAVGTDDQILYADSSTGTGLRWGDAPYSSEFATPVEFRYPDSATMIADQGNQTTNFFEYVRDTDTFYLYLGTTNGDLTDYLEITDPSVVNILRGKSLPAVHIVYANATAMYGDQKKQVTGALYRTADDDKHFEFIGTATAGASDYKEVGGGGTASPLTTKGDLYVYDTADNRLPIGADGQILIADSAQAAGMRWGAAPATVTNTSDLVNDGSDSTSTYVELDELGTVATSNDYNDLTNLPTILTPSGLEALDEGNGIGWRLIGKPQANYGSIGLNAVDLSHSSQATNANGALGNYSFTAGLNNIAAGDYDVVMGLNNSTHASPGYNFILSESSISGANSYNGFIAGGYQNDIDGYGNFVTGSYHIARPNATQTAGHAVSGIRNRPTGYYMKMHGAGLIGTGAYTAVFGVGNVDFSENTGGSTVVQRKLLVVGNGTVDGTGNRLTSSDAFNIYNEGQVIADSMTTTHIDGWGNGKILVTREWIEAQSFSTGSYSSPVTTKGDLFTYDTDEQRLPVGSNGQILSANSATATGLEWIAAPSGGGSPLTTKGDLFVYDTDDQRLAVGTDGQVLTADSAEATGLKWTNASDSVAYREVPTGLVDGANTVYTMVNTAISIDFIWLYLDGVAHSDFTYNAPTKQITLGFAPTAGTVIEVQYISSLANPFPDITNHNSLSGLNVGDFQHLTVTEKANAATAYTHSQTAHAPADAQKNSDILKAEIEAVLTGEIVTHTHPTADTIGLAELKDELKATAAATGGTANEDIDWSDGIQFPVPMTQDTTLTFSNIVQGKSIMLVVTGNHTVTWPTGVDPADVAGFIGTNTNYVNIYCVDSATPTFLTTLISK